MTLKDLKFLADENFPKTSCIKLKSKGIILESASDILPGEDDEIVLKYAGKNNQVILTFDKDYGELIFRKKLKPPVGIVFFRFTPSHPLEPAEILLKHFKDNAGILTDSFTTIMKGGFIRHRNLKPM